MPSVTYRFVATGVQAVVRSFGDVEAAAERHRAKIRAGAQEERKTYRETERAHARRASSAARGASTDERAAQQRVRAEERARAHVAKIRDRHFADEQRREERARAHVAKVRERYFAQEQRQEERAAAATRRRDDRVQRERTRAMAKRGEAYGSLAGGAALGAGAAALAGGALITGAATRRAMANQDAAGVLSRQSRGAGQVAVDPTVLRKEAEAVARATPGIAAGDVLAGSSEFVGKTGDLETARKMQQTFATMASASGAAVTDIASTAAELREKFKITDDSEMKQALSTLYMQGKSGAFELKDAAGQYGKLGAAAAGFGLDKGVKGVTTLGGLTQIARSATGGPEQAASALEAMFRQVIAQSKRIEKSGAKVYNKDGSKRDIQDILVDTISKVGGTDAQAKDIGLQKIFGEEGIRALRPLIATFNDEVRKGGDGVAAMRAQIEGAIHVPGAWADVQEDAAAAQQSASAKMTGAWEALSGQVGDAVLPVLAELATRLSENQGAIDAFAGTVEVAADALMMLVDFLGTIPGIGDAFKRSPEAERGRIAKELERVDAQIESKTKASIGPMDPSDPLVQRKMALEGKLSALTPEDLPNAQTGPLSTQAYSDKWNELDTPMAARMQKVADNPLNAIMGSSIPGMLGMGKTLFGNNDQQAKLAEAQEGASAAKAILDAAQQSISAADKTAAAADRLAAAAEAQQAASRSFVFGM